MWTPDAVMKIILEVGVIVLLGIMAYGLFVKGLDDK
jgi:hypothetical protein